jgi:hypothetical protein
MATKYGATSPTPPHGLKERFWRQVFVPVYRLLPWRIRRFTIQSLPGSHRKEWPAPDYTPRKPAV